MHIKSTIGGALVGALMLAGTVAAQAATIWSTGQQTNGSGQDLNYSVVGLFNNIDNNSNASYLNTPMPAITPFPGGTAPAVVYSNGAYANGLTFVSVNANGFESGDTSMKTVVYQMSFTLSAETLISGMWAADNGAAMYNNGAFVTGLFTQGNSPEANYNSTHAFSFLGQVGLNTLNFFVTDGGGPSAFAFSASAVPGPVLGAGLPGLVMAMGGFLAWRRRRMAAA